MFPSCSSHSIYIDWGTTNFRAYLVSSDGNCIDEKRSKSGVKNIAQGTCESVLNSSIGDWLRNYPVESVILAGMVGSEIGWHDVKLAVSPCAPFDLAKANFSFTSTNGTKFHIVPGVFSEPIHRPAGMMRGEEVQVFGALEATGLEAGTICLPGSHSKWVGAQNKKIDSISTFMTGELFEILSTRSVLSSVVAQDAEEFEFDDFFEGVDLAFSGRNLMQLVFSIRTEAIAMGNGNPARDLARLSGILLGVEIHSVATTLKDSKEDRCIVLVADGVLKEMYCLAMGRFDLSPICVDAKDAFIRGCRIIENSISELRT